MKKNLTIALILFAFVISCNKKEETAPNANASSKKAEAIPQTEVQQLKNDSLSYNNGSCIQEFALKDSVATLSFTTDYDTYKKLNPKSRITPEIFISWWNNEMNFNATFVNNTSIVFRDYAFVNRVIIKVLYPDNVVHSTDVTRKDWEAYYGMTTVQIRDNWEKFGRANFNEPGRVAFFNKFKK